MSGDNHGGDTCCCASCGIPEIDDIKLMECDGCDLARYCSDECQEDHRSQHEEACKKRVAKLRDELLFKQPDSTHKGDCPICCVPLPLDGYKSGIHSCCSKSICAGCVIANARRETELRVPFSCPFCREPTYIADEEAEKQRMKRIEMNDPVAMLEEGRKQYNEGEYRNAFEYWSRAAELGEIDAHYRLACIYREGEGVEKDTEKELHHAEEAAIGGHPEARHNLGNYEWINNCNTERAVKHWVISATQGCDLSIKTLMLRFREGYVSKEELTAALRAHKAAVDATKSKQRDVAEKINKAAIERRKNKAYIA